MIPELSAPGKITDAKEDPLFDATVLALSNGIKVVLKHNDFKKISYPRIMEMYKERFGDASGFDGATKYADTVKSITPAKIQSFAKKLLEQGNSIEVVMEP